MKITTTRAALLPALAACAEVATPRGVSPVYAAVLITADANGLRLRSTNGYQMLAVDVPRDTTIEKPGQSMVRAETLLEWATSATGDGQITLTDTGRALLAEQKHPRKAKRTIGTNDPKTAPIAAQMPASGHAISAKALAGLLGRVAPMALKDGADRQYLQGVHLVSRGNALVALALDSLRMGRASIPYSGGPLDVTVPLAAVGDLRKILGKMDRDVIVAATGNAFYVWGGPIQYATQLHAERFPVEVEAIIPERKGPVMRVSREELSAAVRAAKAVRPADPTRGGRIRLVSRDSSLTIRKSGAGGPHEEEIDAGGAIGDVVCPEDWIRDALDFHDSAEYVEFWYNPGNSVVPMAVRSEDTDDVVVMLPPAPEADDIAHAEAA